MSQVHEPAVSADAPAPAGYCPPTVTPLGTLAELTQGGTGGISDGFGFSGDEDTVGSV
jgi:hypothetical protein